MFQHPKPSTAESVRLPPDTWRLIWAWIPRNYYCDRDQTGHSAVVSLDLKEDRMRGAAMYPLNRAAKQTESARGCRADTEAAADQDKWSTRGRVRSLSHLPDVERLKWPYAVCKPKATKWDTERSVIFKQNSPSLKALSWQVLKQVCSTREPMTSDDFRQFI